MKNTTIAILFVACSLASCSRKSNDNEQSQAQQHHTSLSFPNAKDFLPDWSKQNTLVFMVQSDPANLNPLGAVSLNATTVLGLTQGYLMINDLEQPQMVPVLVKSLPQVSADGLSYTYELLDEAAWDDGSPITAADVVFTLKATKCPLTNDPIVKPYVENIKEVVADSGNPKKFTIAMKGAYVENLHLVANFPILSQKFFDPQHALDHFTFEQLDDSAFVANEALNKWSTEFNDGKYANDPASFYGAGPYKVVNWEHGNTITLERKPNHWSQNLQHPNIYLNSFPDQIIFKVVKDENAMLLEFKSQSIDASNILSTQALTELQKDSSFNRNYNSAFMESYNMNFIALNMRPDGVVHKKIFDDIKVRKAMAYLVPVDQIIDVVVLGKALRWPSMVSPLKPEYNKDLALIPFDPTQAGKLLDDAGWKDTDGDGVRDKVVNGEKIPLQIEFTYGSQGNLTKDIANMIAEAAIKGGVKIIPKPVEAPVLQQNARDHDFDMLMAGLSTPAILQDYSQTWSSSSWINKGTNFSGFGNATSDALIDSIKHTINDSLRHEMSKRFQKMVYDEQPCVFLYSTYRKVAIHKRWGNQIMTAESPSMIINNLKLLSSPGGTVKVMNRN